LIKDRYNHGAILLKGAITLEMLPQRVLQVVALQGLRASRPALSTSAALRSVDVQISQEDKDKWYPKVGNRDIVGFGFNGNPNYLDHEAYPCPAVRFRENTDDVLALREKEKGDWKSLSLEDKKALYRASFCKTFAEMKAPTGNWKKIISIVLFGFSLTGWTMIFMRTQVYPPKPHTITREWMEANLEMMVKQGQGPITGAASMFDYEKKDWK